MDLWIYTEWVNQSTALNFLLVFFFFLLQFWPCFVQSKAEVCKTYGITDSQKYLVVQHFSMLLDQTEQYVLH